MHCIWTTACFIIRCLIGGETMVIWSWSEEPVTVELELFIKQSQNVKQSSTKINFPNFIKWSKNCIELSLQINQVCILYKSYTTLLPRRFGKLFNRRGKGAGAVSGFQPGGGTRFLGTKNYENSNKNSTRNACFYLRAFTFIQIYVYYIIYGTFHPWEFNL